MRRHRGAHAESALGADMERVALGRGIVSGEDAARLDGRDDDAVDGEVEGDDPRRLGEGLRDGFLRSPRAQSSATLPGAASHSTGAPGFTASAGSITAGIGA